MEITEKGLTVHAAGLSPILNFMEKLLIRERGTNHLSKYNG